MAFHCMNCNGSMVFDPSTQQMRCEHCGSTCGPEDFDAAQDRTSGLATFVCQNCGAELEGTDDSLVGFCPYCGGQSIVSRPGADTAVEGIIPFQVTRESCIEAYGAYAQRIPYLRREFRDPEHIKKFTGIYMPFYQYDAEFGATHVVGEQSRRHANYTEVLTYAVDVDLEGSYEHGTPFDASKYLDDEISARCMPFDAAEVRPFRPSYLAGYYADASTVEPELYYEDAKVQAEADLLAEISERVEADHSVPVKANSHIDTEVTGHHSVLFPLWFLTWRNDDRVAYAVINGQSGQVVSDLPLDLKSFALGSVLISAILFALFELLLAPTPGLTAFVSLVAALVMAWAIHASTKRAYDTMTHARDKGWTSRRDVINAPISGMKKHRMATLSVTAIIAVTCFYLTRMLGLAGFLGSVGRMRLDVDTLFDARGSGLMRITPLVVLGIGIFVLFRVLRWHRELKQMDAPLAIGVLLASVLVNAIVIFVAPVNDLWYYVGDIVCIAGLIGSSIALLRVYNLSTTRPLPKLFDREEV